ncbi:hypothetical protein TKK_0017192 [Trichogramma kaykai]|uniref:DH domain-containing protein n=1 Tax=Trichogramma kaykai TaxID=54128 RepID=A0ABD2W695_9HYME
MEEEVGECDVTISDEKFQEPQRRFWLRSRKRPKSDAISVSSMDISIDSTMDKRKKRRKISEVASSFFGSGKKANLNQTISGAELSFAEVDDAPASPIPKKNCNENDAASVAAVKSWVTDVATQDLTSKLTGTEIKRQELIYELFCGENTLLNELNTLKDYFLVPLTKTNIFTKEELSTLFNNLDQLITVHSDLRDELKNIRNHQGSTAFVGPTLNEWMKRIPELYIERSKTQVWAKQILDVKKSTCKRYQEFIKKRSEVLKTSDMWTYIDSCRSRIVKYPILIDELLKHTIMGHIDGNILLSVREFFSDLLKKIDTAMGLEECKVAQSKIIVKAEYDPKKYVETAIDLVLEGTLKDPKGNKYHCFLFNNSFCITKSNRKANKKYNMCFPVIPINDITVETLNSNNSSASFEIKNQILVCNDEHHRRHWLDCFKRTIKHLKDSKKKRKNVPVQKENEPEYDDELDEERPPGWCRETYIKGLRDALLRHGATVRAESKKSALPLQVQN